MTSTLILSLYFIILFKFRLGVNGKGSFPHGTDGWTDEQAVKLLLSDHTAMQWVHLFASPELFPLHLGGGCVLGSY